MTASNTIKLSDIATIKSVRLHQVRADDLIINITDKGKIFFLSVFDDASKILSSDIKEDYNNLKNPLITILNGNRCDKKALVELKEQTICFADFDFDKKNERQLLDSLLNKQIDIIRISNTQKDKYLPAYIKAELNNLKKENISYFPKALPQLEEKIKSFIIREISKNEQIDVIYKDTSLKINDLINKFLRWEGLICNEKQIYRFNTDHIVYFFKHINNEEENSELIHYYKDIVILLFSLQYFFIDNNNLFPESARKELSNFINKSSASIIKSFYIEILHKNNVTFDFYKNEWDRLHEYKIPLICPEQHTCPDTNESMPFSVNFNDNKMVFKKTIPEQHTWPEINESMSFYDIFKSFIRTWHITKNLFCNNILKLLSEDVLPIKELTSQDICDYISVFDKDYTGTVITNYISPFLFQLLKHVKNFSEIKIENNKIISQPAQEFKKIIEIFDKKLDFLISNSDQLIYNNNENKLCIFDVIVLAKILRSLPSRAVLTDKIFGVLSDILNKSKTLQIEAEARSKEQLKLRRSFSHHIRNMLSAAILNPLELIRDKGIDKEGIIDQALRGANLLREIVNTMNLSFSGSKDDFIDDIQGNPDEKALPINTILETGLRGAFANMMDGKYFNKYYSIYYKKPEQLLAAKKDFLNLPPGNMETLLEYGRKYLIENIEFDIPKKILSLKIGNKRNSALKMIILFQEVCMNAVKNSAFVDNAQRFLKFEAMKSSDGDTTIAVVNSYEANSEDKGGTLLGDNIIADLSSQMGFKHTKNTLEGKYIKSFTMPIKFETE